MMMLVFYPILSKIGYGMKKREAVFVVLGCVEIKQRVRLRTPSAEI